MTLPSLPCTNSTTLSERRQHYRTLQNKAKQSDNEGLKFYQWSGSPKDSWVLEALNKGANPNQLVDCDIYAAEFEWDEKDESQRRKVVHLIAQPIVFKLLDSGFSSDTWEELILAGLNLNVLNHQGESVLMSYIQKYRSTPAVVKLMLTHGADPYLRCEQKTALSIAVEEGVVDMFDAILPYCEDELHRCIEGRSLLHLAAGSDFVDEKMLIHLLKKGINPCLKSDHGKTARQERVELLDDVKQNSAVSSVVLMLKAAEEQWELKESLSSSIPLELAPFESSKIRL